MEAIWELAIVVLNLLLYVHNTQQVGAGLFQYDQGIAIVLYGVVLFEDIDTIDDPIRPLR